VHATKLMAKVNGCSPLQLQVNLYIQCHHHYSTFISTVYNFICVQPHRSTRASGVVTLSRPPSSSSLKFNNRFFRHALPCLWNHHHCHHPLLLLLSNPGSKLIFFTNPFLYSCSTFPPTGLTPRTPAVFRFFSGTSVLTLAPCARLASS